jgi:anti-sigma factor RsiW
VSSVDLHPEDLLDRARRGEASPDELHRLRMHLAACAACRFEHVLADDCARAAAPSAPASQDAQLLSRVRKGASRAVRARASAARGRNRRGAKRLVFAAAALLLFAGTFAAATTVVRRVWHRGPDIEPVERAARPARVHHKMGVASSGTLAAAGEAPATPAADEAFGPDDAAPGIVEAPKPTVAPLVRHARTVAAESETPGDLFSRANAARREGKTREAARLYRLLQREFPGTSEELVSRVTLGRWMLDRLNDPSGALARFDSYLANPVHTALREEALIGRALALGRLGRETEERGAWTAFLAAFPGSVYAERARGRLEILR